MWLIIKIIFFCSPRFIQNFLEKKKQQKMLTIWKERQKTKVSKQYINELFDNIPFHSDVFLHTSLFNIGKIEGGYKEVVWQLNARILDKGYTLLCSALAYKGSSEDFLKQKKIFDVRTEPVEMGTINEYYALLPEAKRSMSPTHSVCAVGRKAEYYTQEHHLAVTPFTELSPYFKIAKNKGVFLLFGSELHHLTFVHVLEDLLGNVFGNIYTKAYEVQVINESGEKYSGRFKAHNRFRALMRKERNIFTSIRQLPSTRIFPLGCSELILLDSIDVMLCLLNLAKQGQSINAYFNVSNECEKKIEYWTDYFQQLKNNN